MKKLIVLIGMAVLLGGCGNPNPSSEEINPGEQSGRFKIVSAQRYVSANGYSRYILSITDSNTGDEFMAVEGACIREVVHSGKTTHED